MKLKVCGMKYKDNIEAVAALKVDFMGFIFYEKSKRFVGEDFSMPNLPEEIVKVGVFVNAPIEYIIAKVLKYNLGLIQLHGDEGVDYCENLVDVLSLNDKTAKVKIVKAFGVDEDFDFNEAEQFKNFCQYFLFDTKTKGYGGSGKKFNWNVLKKYKANIPYFLSGGIGLNDIDQVKEVNAFAIDVNSKFEVEPGLKNVEELKKIKIN